MDLVVTVVKFKGRRDGGVPEPQQPVLLLQHANYQHSTLPNAPGGKQDRVGFPFDAQHELELLLFDDAAATEEEQFVGQASVQVAQMLHEGVTSAAVPLFSPLGLRGHVHLKLDLVMRNKQQQQPVPQRPAAGIRASRSDVGEPHDDESPFASQQQHAWAGSAGGGASCASPTTPPLNASTSFGRRLTRFLPSWGSSSGGGSSFKSVASFGRSRGVGGSARSSAEAVVSADAADAAAVGAAARDPLASMEATGQGPMTSFRRRLTSTSSDAGQDAAPSTPPAPQAAPMAMLAQERPQRRSLSPITESPTPKSPRPQDQAVAAASRARARSSSYSPGPQVVVLTGPGEVDVLHTGYSSDDEDGPAGAMQPSERQVRLLLAHQTAQAQADQAAVVAALAAQAAQERAEVARLYGSLAAAGASGTAAADATSAGGRAGAGGRSPTPAAGGSGGGGGMYPEVPASLGASCTPEFASPYLSLSSSLASLSDAEGLQKRLAATQQAPAQLFGSSISNPAALRREALARGTASMSAAAGAAAGQAAAAPTTRDGGSYPPVPAACSEGGREHAAGEGGRSGSPLQRFKHGYPALDGPATPPQKQRQQLEDDEEEGSARAVSWGGLGYSDSLPRAPLGPAGACVEAAHVMPAFMCVDARATRSSSGGCSSLGGSGEYRVRRMSYGVGGSLKGGRWQQPSVYVPYPYSVRPPCFPLRHAYEEPSAPVLRVGSSY